MFYRQGGYVLGMGKVELLSVLELNFSNPEFRTRSIKLEVFRQNITTKYITANLFGVIIPLQNMFITAQRFQVIWMFPFQRHFKFGKMQSADEKHLSADTNVTGVAEYLIIIFFAKLGTVAVCV